MNSVRDTKPIITLTFLDKNLRNINRIKGITESPKVIYDIAIKNFSGILFVFNY
jgi:hypothetical protein